MTYTERAIQLRPYIEKSVGIALTDKEALEAVELFPVWEKGIEITQKMIDEGGNRYSFNNVLYKCGIPHTTQADWTPDLTPNMWAAVDVGHAGTIDDPIPAARNMEYTYFLYYLDPEDGKTYLCQYGDEDTQGTVKLAYLPHEVVGIYFKVVSV